MEKELEEYALLDSQEKEIASKKALLRTKITEDLVAKGEKGAVTPFGRFSISELKTWTYTKAFAVKEKAFKASIKELSDEVKALKATEESTGDATFESRPSLSFSAIKI